VTYSAPHWVDKDGNGNPTDTANGEKDYSVAYTRNTKPSIGAKFSIQGLPNNLAIKLRAKGSDGIEIPETAAQVNGNDVTLAVTASSTNWPNTIKFYDRSDANKAFKLDWEIKVGDAGWAQVASTKHQVYLTLNDPIKVAGANENQETLFNLGCRNADGVTVPNATVQAIWNDFSDRIVSRVTPQTGKADLDLNKGGGQPDGMIYWEPGATICRTVEDFLKIGHTSCGTWAQFMEACLNFQGINGAQVSIVNAPIPANYNQSTIDYKAHANFGGNVYYLSYNNLNGNNVPNNLNNGDRVLRFQSNNGVNGGIFYVKQLNLGGQKFVAIPVNDAGFPNSNSQAQGNKNARAWFGNHAIIKYDGKYYDPSYGGNLFAAKQAWEDASLQHFGGLIEVLEYNAQNNSFAAIDFLLWIEKDDPKGVLNTKINP